MEIVDLSKPRSKSKTTQKSLCDFNLSLIDELERVTKPTIAVMQAAKMLCIFLEVFRERSVHFLSSAESLITWP